MILLWEVLFRFVVTFQRLTLQGGDSSPVSALRRAPLVVVGASAPLAFPWGKVPPKEADEGNATQKLQANSEKINNQFLAGSCLRIDLLNSDTAPLIRPSVRTGPPSPRGRLLDAATIVNPPMERAEAR